MIENRHSAAVGHVGKVDRAALARRKSRQATLARPIQCVGVGLHSGARVAMTLKPGDADTGILFRRTDLSGLSGPACEIPARWDRVVDTRLCTVLANDAGARVGTVEHLMAALYGSGVDNAVVELDGPEVPIMDGSAQPFVFLVECAGLRDQQAPVRFIEVLKEMHVEADGCAASLAPAEVPCFGFEIDFGGAAVWRQEIAITLINGTFKNEIARARTFGFLEEVEHLHAQGLALGGSLDNAVVVKGGEVLNEDGLRYRDEFVRHKVLDAVGDLYLAGAPILGRFRGVRSGHALNNRLLQCLFADRDAWRIVDLTDGAGDAPPAPMAVGEGAEPIAAMV